MVRPNELLGSDHPITLVPNSTDNVWRARVKENIDILWRRVQAILQELDGVQTEARTLAPSTPQTLPPAVTPIPTPTGDEFRYFASMINFEYDHWEVTRNSDQNIVTVEFDNGGAMVAMATIAYNSEKQPTIINMTGANTGTLTFNYNSDGYLVSTTRT